MPIFERYIGVDYSGAETAESGLPGLRVFVADWVQPPREERPTGIKRHWTRRGLAEWLRDRLAEDRTTLVGIDHGFSFPLRYFETYHLPPDDWPAFLDDFRRHWPTDDANTYVDFILDGMRGNGAARLGKASWLRLTERWARVAGSVFRFHGQGSVGKSTHAGLPWLRYLRQHAGSRVHFWPFDGWGVPAGKSVIAEAYPSLWSKRFERVQPSTHQHDAYVVAAWLRRADLDGHLAPLFIPPLEPRERLIANAEGWILGVV